MSYDFIQITDGIGERLFIRHNMVEAIGVNEEPENKFTKLFVGTGWYKAQESPEEIISRIRDAEMLREMEDN